MKYERREVVEKGKKRMRREKGRERWLHKLPCTHLPSEVYILRSEFSTQRFAPRPSQRFILRTQLHASESELTRD